MSRRLLAPLLATLALLVATGVAGVGAWHEARLQGWLDDGLERLVLLDFLRRFDPWAGAALGGAVLLLVVAWLLGRWRPAAGGLGTALAIVAGAGLLRLGALWADVRGPGRPNLVLISIDTLRADRLGAYGYVPPTSPVFDRRLAAESVIFENVLSQSPKTTPSHMTLLTSLYPSTHGIALWDGQSTEPALNPRVDTLAEVLRNAGYATAAFTGGAHMHRSRGFGQGFQRYRHSDQLRRAREWLHDKAGRSFFLFFHTYQVHDPYAPPLETIPLFDQGEYGDGPILDVVRRIRAGGDGGWEHGHRAFWDAVDEGNPRDVRFISHLYDAGIRHMDDGTLTALLDELDALDLTRDTLVVLTSDHGEAFGEHGRFLHDDLNAVTLHVPLVLRFPGRLPGGTRVTQRVELVDVMPTILELLDLPAPPDMQGQSLLPLVRGGDARVDDTAISEYGNPATGRVFESIRRGADALIRDGERVQLFDLTSDPGEQRDRAAADPARVATLRAELDGWRARCAVLAERLGPRGRDGEGPDAETMRRLRALGYVE